jgi:hypothetical protein
MKSRSGWNPPCRAYSLLNRGNSGGTEFHGYEFNGGAIGAERYRASLPGFREWRGELIINQINVLPWQATRNGGEAVINKTPHRVARTSLLALAVGVAGTAGFPDAASAQAQTSSSPQTRAEGTGADIVVTAQRRNELLEDVPMAVQVVSAEAVENSGVTNSWSWARLP